MCQLVYCRGFGQSTAIVLRQRSKPANDHLLPSQGQGLTQHGARLVGQKREERIIYFSVIKCFHVMSWPLVSLNKGMATTLVYPTNPLGIELYSYANVFFCFGSKDAY